jgi:hypothetical protein
MRLNVSQLYQGFDQSDICGSIANGFELSGFK